MGYVLIVLAIGSGELVSRSDTWTKPHIYETLDYCQMDAIALFEGGHYYGRCVRAKEIETSAAIQGRLGK